MKEQMLLVNLPKGFFKVKVLKPVFARLEARAQVRKRSWDTLEDLAPDLAWADAVIMWGWPTLTEDVLKNCPRLRFAGHLDVNQPTARAEFARGLTVSLAKKAWSPAVAEMALTLILACLRKTSMYHAAMRTGKEKWVRRFPDDIDPDERQLTGRSVGIVGFGAIGRRLAELLGPFSCKIAIFDPYLPEGVETRYGAQRMELGQLMESSEVVVICAASNPGTRRLIGKKEIRALRKGAVFVNVARSALVDYDELARRLKKREIYAALDVFDREPLERTSPLRKLENAFLTPHRAGGIMESVVRIITWLVDDYEAFLDGKPLAHRLTEDMLPSLDG